MITIKFFKWTITGSLAISFHVRKVLVARRFTPEVNDALSDSGLSAFWPKKIWQQDSCDFSHFCRI